MPGQTSIVSSSHKNKEGHIKICPKMCFFFWGGGRFRISIWNYRQWFNNVNLNGIHATIKHIPLGYVKQTPTRVTTVLRSATKNKHKDVHSERGPQIETNHWDQWL